MAVETSCDPFQDFEIASLKPLEGLKRSLCPQCKASRMYFCYTCYKYVDGVDALIFPRVKLPIKVDIIKHPKELDGKSTAVHAALLAPDDVCIYTYPVFPHYEKENINAVLLFPGPEAKSLEEIYQNSVSSLKRSNVDHTGDVPSKRPRVQSKHQSSLDNSTEESSKPSLINDDSSKRFKYERIVMIDSTWNQVHAISSDQRLQGLPRVELSSRNTVYWRRQHRFPDTYLSTIEALYCFSRQFHETFLGTYDKRYDNILYFFKFFYQMVHKNKAAKAFKNE